MSRADLLALAERVEVLERPSRDLDAEISVAVFTPEDWRPERYLAPSKRACTVTRYVERSTGKNTYGTAAAPCYTWSLDAVLALCTEKLRLGLLDIEGSWEPRDAAVWPAWSIRWYPAGVKADGKSWRAIVATAATPALALLAATLRALATEHADDPAPAQAGEVGA